MQRSLKLLVYVLAASISYQFTEIRQLVFPSNRSRNHWWHQSIMGLLQWISVTAIVLIKKGMLSNPLLIRSKAIQFVPNIATLSVDLDQKDMARRILWLRAWSRSGRSYGNNTRVICCPAPGRPESAARGTSPGLPGHPRVPPPVATKPSGFVVGFCGDRRPSGHVFHTSRQAMIKTYIIALWGWFSRDVLPVTCCEHGPPSIATVHFSNFSIATNILFN